jgi:hypothetical protein
MCRCSSDPEGRGGARDEEVVGKKRGFREEK